MGLNTKPEYNNRWYDKYPDLRIMLDTLREMKKRERDKIILEVKELINSRDKGLFDKYVFEFPLSLQKRWYDKNPFSWLVINAMKYADEDLLTDIILYLKERL
jgi:hypothetical protein